MNLGGAKAIDGGPSVLQVDEDDTVDPHLERIKNQAADDSDEEVNLFIFIYFGLDR